METKTNELKYEIVSEEAYIVRLYFNIDFVVDEKEYRASCTYITEHGLEDVLVEDDKSNELDEDSDIYQLGLELLTIMEINNNNLTW